MVRKRIPAHLYQFLIVESRGLCSLCHEDNIAQIHHIVPSSEGGTNDYENLIPLCASCHSNVHKTKPDRLFEEKKLWVSECEDVITGIIKSSADPAVHARTILRAYHALDDVPNFRGFRDRLSDLLANGDVFRNLFRVKLHQIRHHVDHAGNSRTVERQLFAPFVDVQDRRLHLSGSIGATWEDIQFRVRATFRGSPIPISVFVRLDDPRFKIVEIAFENRIEANALTQMDWNYLWPQAWALEGDQYTYDVFGYVERLEYEMEFPAHVAIKSVSSSFIDLFGCEWPRFGRSKVVASGFRWEGTRLPMLSRVVIRYAASTIRGNGTFWHL